MLLQSSCRNYSASVASEQPKKGVCTDHEQQNGNDNQASTSTPCTVRMAPCQIGKVKLGNICLSVDEA